MNGSACKSTTTGKKRSFNTYSIKKEPGGWWFRTLEHVWNEQQQAFQDGLRRDQFFPASLFAERAQARLAELRPSSAQAQ
jgi:hypothetical protein